MLTNSDATLVISPFADAEDPFSYGDQTVLQLQAQPFEVQDAFGTVVTMPIDTAGRNPLAPLAAVPAAAPLETVFADEDPIARLERKVDLALQKIAVLQQYIESLDATLARVLAR